MYICILGRQPALGMAELERLYGADTTRWFSDESALVQAAGIDTQQLGGTLKAGEVALQLRGDWPAVSKAIIQHYSSQWANIGHKVTLGISAYGFKAAARDVQKTGLLLKQTLKKSGANLRLIPNDYPALNTAASHHNKLGLSPNKVELLCVRAGNGSVIVAQSVGAQNITALAARDQARPHTDAFVGMLPPKLARIMVNLSGLSPQNPKFKIQNLSVLDPFCGTGVVLQEALLDGYTVYGTDLSDKMVDYTTKNLAWLQNRFHTSGAIGTISQGDAMDYQWPQAATTGAVVAETYLGQPFSAPPSPAKLAEVRGNCNHIISEFLKNAARQFNKGTVVVLAVPAWRGKDGTFTHLPLVAAPGKLGFERVALKNVRNDQLLYYRETQVVARELLVLVKK